MALSKIVENSITDGVVSSAKLKDFAAAVDLNGVELILDADQDTSITADTDDRIDFKLGGVEHISLNNSSGDTVIKPMVDAKDIIFQQYDGNKILEINDGNYVGIGGNAAGAGEIRIYEDTDNGSHYTGFKAGNNTASVAYVLPTADGSASQALITDGSGTLSWSTISTALDDLTAGDAAVTLATSAGNITIDAQGSDTDIIFKGTDGGADTTYMTIDGSAGGDLFLTGGLIDLKNDGSAVSQIKFYCESSNAHAQTLIGAPHSESATNTLTLPSTGGNSYLLTAASTATVTNKTFTSPKINEDVAVTATATELNLLDGVSGLVQADLTKLAAVDSTAAELNIVDGGTSASSVTVVDADRVVLNDGGTMKQVAVTDLSAYFDDEITAMPNLTSVGTLTALTVDDVAVDGKVITMTGSSGDTFVTTVAANGATSLVTTDASAAAAHLTITADGTVDINSAGVLTLDSGAAINIEPASGSAILLDGTISIDAGVVTGATSVTSTAFVGNLTGTVATATQNSITTMTGLTAVGAAGTVSTVAGVNILGTTTANIGMGLNALNSITTADRNVAIGDEAGTAITEGNDNTAVGNEALVTLNTGTSNTAIGKNALKLATTAANNTAVGRDSLAAATTGDSNVAVGKDSMIANTTGTLNTAIGAVTLYTNTTGGYNTAIGLGAMYLNTTASQNTAIGYTAMRGNTTGTRNLAIGYQAYRNSDTENDNIAIGYQAMVTDTAGGTKNTAIGNYALDAHTSGDQNTAVGYNALSTNTTAENNTAVGVDALLTCDGSNNTGIGVNALKLSTTGTQNVAVGHNALTANTTASQNTAVGQESLKANTTGTANVAVGAEALKANTTADNNTAVGMNSLLANTTGASNTGLGSHALVANTTGGSNIAVGINALAATTTGSNNVAVGASALDANTDGELNTAVGDSAMTTNIGGSNNTAVGRECLRLMHANANTGLGAQAGAAISSGDNNTCLGYESGNAITSGDNNITVGKGADAASATSSNAIVMGTDISGDGDRFMFGKPSNVVYNDFVSNASWTRSSDERKKTNIANATLGLDFINDLRTVTFKWKRSQDIPNTLDDYDADVNHMNTDVTMHGMLAQEVKAALDTAGVTTFAGWQERSDGSQCLSQEMFVQPLIKAIQELSAKVDAQQNEIDALKDA